MKDCPFCAESIQDKAIKCRYCGEWLDAPSAGGSIKAPSAASPPRDLDRPHLKPLTQCPEEEHALLIQAFSKYFPKEAQASAQLPLEQRSSLLADQLYHHHPEALAAIYKIFGILPHHVFYSSEMNET